MSTPVRAIQSCLSSCIGGGSMPGSSHVGQSTLRTLPVFAPPWPHSCVARVPLSPLSLEAGPKGCLKGNTSAHYVLMMGVPCAG